MPIGNLTPHPITIYDESGVNVLGTIPGCPGSTARIETKDTPAETTRATFQTVREGEIWDPAHRGDVISLDIPTVQRDFGEIVGVPPDQGVTYIVSLPVLMHPRLRRAAAGPDVYFVAPDTGKGAVRDAKGNILGVRGFIAEPR